MHGSVCVAMIGLIFVATLDIHIQSWVIVSAEHAAPVDC
jgi:hypothetical protein